MELQQQQQLVHSFVSFPVFDELASSPYCVHMHTRMHVHLRTQLRMHWHKCASCIAQGLIQLKKQLLLNNFSWDKYCI